MGRYLLRRLLLAVPTLLGITLLTFFVAHAAPGDPLQLDGERMTVPTGASTRTSTEPWPAQYATWLTHLARGDFGHSLIDRRPVAEKMGEALPRTVLVSSLALVLAWVGALPLGTWLAVRRGGRLARTVAAGLSIVSAFPTFWVAVLLLLVFANPAALDWFPFQGWPSGEVTAVAVAWHLVLPVLVLALPSFALSTRHVRAAMEEALARPEVLAARGRGVPERRVLIHHALRGSLGPLLTLAGLQLPHLVGGSVVVERVFGLPGMGLLALDAVGTRDYPVVMGVAVVMGLATLLATLAVDLAYAWADPRVRQAVRT